MKPLWTRILTAASTFPGHVAPYHSLMYKVWPFEKYPKAYRNSVNGGPPGVAMVYGKALREMQQEGLIWRGSFYDDKGHYTGQPAIHLSRSGDAQ